MGALYYAKMEVLKITVHMFLLEIFAIPLKVLRLVHVEKEHVLRVDVDILVQQINAMHLMEMWNAKDLETPLLLVPTAME